MTFGFSKASGWEGGTKLKARRKGCLFSLSEVESEKRFVRDTLIPSHYSKSFVFFYYYRWLLIMEKGLGIIIFQHKVKK